ncbi:MAG: hypothetical protein HYR71_11555, partial [Chloroflexi bacterium]|nr:hypothetical protein [Chloroflexota bacterium]
PLLVWENSRSSTSLSDLVGFASGQYAGRVSCDQKVAIVTSQFTANSRSAYSSDTSRSSTTWYVPDVFNNYYGYYSNLVVQNVSEATVASITVQIYNSSGANVATQTATNVPANGYANFEQTGLANMVTNALYSARVTASGNVAVVANIFGQGALAGTLFTYMPFSSGAPTFYVPIVMKNYYGYRTAIVVQNIGSSATTVTVNYGNGVVDSRSNVNPLASVEFYTPNNPQIQDGTLTPATIQSSNGQPIVASVNEANSYNRTASYAGFSFSAGTQTVRAPTVLRRYNGYNTSVTCQNIGSASTAMIIAYSGITGTSNPTTPTLNSISPNNLAMFYLPADTLVPDNYIGSATVTSSSQSIVCVVNEDRNEGTDATTIFDQLSAYEAYNR